MEAHWIGLAGVVIGAVATLGATWLNVRLSNARGDRLARLRKARLLTLLNSQKFVWRDLSTLQQAIGADEETTVGLLLELGCRQSMAKGKKSWALLSRAPFPKDVA